MMFELKQPHTMISFLGRARSYSDDLDVEFKDAIGHRHFANQLAILNKHNDFLTTHFDKKIDLFEKGSFSQNETQFEAIRRFASELEVLHETYCNEVVAECENAIRHDKGLTAESRESLLKTLYEFKQKLTGSLNPTSYCEHALKENEKDSIINEKFNEAIKSLDTETVASILECTCLVQKEVLRPLTLMCQERCTQFCTQEYKTHHTQYDMCTTFYAEMSEAIYHLIEYLSAKIGIAFEEKCVKNDAFNGLKRVKKRLTKAAIIQCWNDFTQTLSYIEETCGYEFTSEIARFVYETNLMQ